MSTSLWRDGYGAIPQQQQRAYESNDSFLPGPEDVKTFPDRWRKAPAYFVIIIVHTPSLDKT